MRSIAVTIRVCISVKLSPPGKRNVDGARCTVPHSGSFISCFSSAPVHSPKSHSSSPRAICTLRSTARPIGAAVSRVRSSGDAYTASTVRPPVTRAPIRSAAVWACWRPGSARCRPFARPGSTLPVVGVCPWRTSRTSVAGGGAALRRSAIGSGWGAGHESLPSYRPMTAAALRRVAREVATCRICPRLVAWREEVGVVKRAAYRDDDYWCRGVPGFGDPKASVLVLGLAPAAHGANRTGRMFTGDRSGDWLYRAMHRAGFANQPTSDHRGDGLELRGAWVTSAVKCAPPGNHPLPAERDACRPFLEREIAELRNLRVVVCLGAFGYEAACHELGVKPRPKFGHGVEVAAGD